MPVHTKLNQTHFMLTTTAEKSVPTLENEMHLVEQSIHSAITSSEKNQPLKSILKKLYLHVSVIGIVLVICILFIGVKNQDVIMIECFKALLIVASLNLLRAYSISKI
ncbi:hypothetical protein GCM10027293_36280 [Pontibacter aydingkolensis]